MLDIYLKIYFKKDIFDKIVLQSPQPNELRPKNVALVH